MIDRAAEIAVCDADIENIGFNCYQGSNYIESKARKKREYWKDELVINSTEYGVRRRKTKLMRKIAYLVVTSSLGIYCAWHMRNMLILMY